MSARGIDVDGRRAASPLQGFGRLWQRTYRVTVPEAEPSVVIAVGKELFGEFWLLLHADADSLTLMTPQGHRFAGWVTFSAAPSADETIVQAQVLMRAGDPIHELGLALGGHRQEDKLWERTLTQVAAVFGSCEPVEIAVVCVDRRRQWRRRRP